MRKCWEINLSALYTVWFIICLSETCPCFGLADYVVIALMDRIFEQCQSFEGEYATNIEVQNVHIR